MTREEIIKSLQHAVDYMSEHEGNRITETTSSGEIIDTVIHKNTLIEAIKLLEEKKTGTWLKEDRGGVEYTAVCSECGYATFWSDAPFYNYCPECGTHMIKDERWR